MPSPFLTWVAQCPWVKLLNYCFWYVIYVNTHAPGPTPSLTEPGSPPVCGSMGPWWAEPECWWAKCSLSPQSREPGPNDHLWTKNIVEIEDLLLYKHKKSQTSFSLKVKQWPNPIVTEVGRFYMLFLEAKFLQYYCFCKNNKIRREYSLITGCGYSKKEHSLRFLQLPFPHPNYLRWLLIKSSSGYLKELINRHLFNLSYVRCK